MTGQQGERPEPRDWLTDEEEAHIRRSLAASRASDWSDTMMRRAIGSLDRARSAAADSRPAELDAAAIEKALMQPGMWERYLRGAHAADAAHNASLLAEALAAALSGNPFTPIELATRHNQGRASYLASILVDRDRPDQAETPDAS